MKTDSGNYLGLKHSRDALFRIWGILLLWILFSGCLHTVPENPEVRRQRYVEARGRVVRAELAVENWQTQALKASDTKHWRDCMKRLSAARERLRSARRQAEHLAPQGQSTMDGMTGDE